MIQLNNRTFKKEIDGKYVYQIHILKDKEKNEVDRWQSCAICDNYFLVTGKNNKYCPDCRKEENLRNANERYREKIKSENM